MSCPAAQCPAVSLAALLGTKVQLRAELLPEDVEEPLPALGCRSELLVDELLPALLVDALAAELLVLGSFFFSSPLFSFFVLMVEGELSLGALFVEKMSSESWGKISILRDAINVSIFPFLPLAWGVRLCVNVQ